MVGFVNYYRLKTLRREFVQAPRFEQSLVRCDSPLFELTSDGRVTRENGRRLTNQHRLMPCACSPAPFLPPSLAADVLPALQLALPALCC